ncbi:L,D-transpeptidase family protein [Clostridium sp.]
MRLSRRVYMILFMFVIVATVAIATFIKSNSTVAKNQFENSTIVSVNKDTKQLEAQNKLEEQQKLDEQKKLEDQKKLAEQKKLEDQKKLEAQKSQEKQEETEKQETIPKNQTSSSKDTKSVAPPVDSNSKSELLIDKIKGKGNANQAIVVTTSDFGTVNATITTFENVNGTWKQVDSYAGDIGRTGFAYAKSEGDGHSPIGIFSLGTTFGRNSNPGTSMDYKQSTSNDFWVDDVHSPLYNTWQQGPVNGRWNSAEKMYIPQYNYGFVINYNTAERVPAKGSAIFFHVWSGAGNGTAGCISAAEENVIRTLKWLNPSKNPIIIEGPMSEVQKM